MPISDALRQNAETSTKSAAVGWACSNAYSPPTADGEAKPEENPTSPTTAGPNHSSPFTQNPQLRRPVRERQAQPLKVGIPGADLRPPGVERQLVVGQHQRPSLRLGQMVENNHGDLCHAELAGGQQPGVTGNDYAVRTFS